MFAVIKTGGKQYRVAANDVIKVELLAGQAGDVVEIGNVLMVGNGESVTIGAPFVAGAMVTAEVVEQGRSKKTLSFKKRRRQNSKRIKGHRQHLTTIRIGEILTDGAKPSKQAKKPEPRKLETPAEPVKLVSGPVAKLKAVEKPKAAKAEIPAPAKQAPAKSAPVKAGKPAAAKPAQKAEPKAEKPAAAKPAKVEIVDDITLIGGVGPALKKKLEAVGITSLAQIGKMTPKQMAKLDDDLKLGGRTEREEWAEQARELLAGKPPQAKIDQAKDKK